MSKFHVCSVILWLLVVESAISTKLYVIRSNSWPNQMKKCASGGDDSNTYHATIGNIKSVNLTYEDINGHTIVKAIGTFQYYIKAQGEPTTITEMTLNEYKNKVNAHEFHGDWYHKGVIGWATQIVDIGLTITFAKNGDVILDNYVYAGSWGAISCCNGKAVLDELHIYI